MMKGMRKTVFFAILLLAFVSCGKNAGNGEREDIIKVYEHPDSLRAMERSWVSVRGGTYTYYVRSAEPFEVKWQDSGDGWGTVGTPQKAGDGLWKVDFTAKPLSSRTLQKGETLYSRRFGVIMFTHAARYLGCFLMVEQGMDVRRYDDFAAMNGCAEPNATYADLRIDRWTASQTGLGYTSTVINPADSVAYVYSKDGYIKLGSDDGYGADFITPSIPAIQDDTLLVLSFNAVAQSGATLPDFQGGTEPITPMRVRRAVPSGELTDSTCLTVRVEGGGFIRDVIATEGTSITFTDVPAYDTASPGYPGDIFEGARFLVFIEGTERNPISVNTRIHFEAGDMSGAQMPRCNRIFLDDICIYRASMVFDEDIFPLAGRSGLDRVL